MKKVLLLSLLILANAICFAQNFKSQGLDTLFQILKEHNKFMGTIAISQNGKLLYSNSVGYSDVENSKKAEIKTKYRIGSISKIFTASLIFKAIEEKKLALNQPLNKYFPEIENSKIITIRNLLDHSSGIHDFTKDKIYSSYFTESKSEKQMIEIIAKGKSDFEPNSKVEYSNSNYIVLSFVLERIYKKPYSAILDSKIINPLALKNTYYGGKIQIQNSECYSYHFKNKWVKAIETNLSIPTGAGAIVSNPTDLTVFIEQLFNGKVISQKSLSIMKTMKEYHGIGMGMGMLEFTNFEKKSYGHNGAIDNFTSLLNYFPEEKLSVAVTSNGSTYPIDSLLSCALSCYFDKPFAMPTFNYLTLTPEGLGLFIGQYVNQNIPLKIAITINDNKLFGQVKGQPAFPLEATSKNVFKFEQAGLVLEFYIDRNQMILKQGGKELMFTKE